MAENSQLSDETKNNSTDTSSTDASSVVIGNHENAVVPHKISNHDKLVQTMVMVDGEWINVNDTNDQANMKEDVHKVNKKVVEAQKGIVEAKNAADSAVKYADSAVSASKVNSDAIAAQSSAIIEAKAATDSATAEVQQLKANTASDAASIRADVAAASETLMGQGKQIATINTTLDGLNTKYEGFSDNLSKLSGTVAINSTQIDQNKKSIALKADQATVDNLSGEVSRNTAQLKVQADQISSKVSSEDFNTLDNKASGAIAQIDKNTTAIDQTNKQISLKADQTEVNQVKQTATQNSSRLNVMSNEIQSKVTSTDVNNIINEKGFTTQSTVQSIVNQKAGTLNESITKLSNNTATQFQSITASIDGLQSAVTNYQKDASSKYTQLSDLMQSKVNKGELESVRTQLASSINERIQKGNLITQFNLEAGRTLIQSNKIYFDADSFVMSPNSKAFIPSAYITNINADKITTGTLHSITINNGNGTFRVDPDGNVYANSMHVNHGSIYQGTVLGADVYSISNLTSNSLDKVNDATQNWVKLKDGTIELHGANGNHYSSIMPVDISTSWNNDGSSDQQHGLGILDSQEIIIGQAALYSDDNNRITHSTNLSMINRTNLTISGSGIQATLAPGWGDSKGAYFTVQKDNKVGFYVGVGDNGNEVQIAGTGAIRLQGRRYIYDGFNDAVTHTLGSLQVDNLHVKKWLGVDSNKNAIVKTSQGTVAINAYETAEYYFGDIGEGQTDSNGVAYVGIEKLFNETVNTSIPYQVFITAYGPGNVWVEQREQDRFMVKSSQPNIKFGWEIKAKRKGYEHTRLQNVDNKLNHMEATS